MVIVKLQFIVILYDINLMKDNFKVKHPIFS